MKNKILLIVAVAVIAAGGAFYGGMIYAKKGTSGIKGFSAQGGAAFGGQDFGNLSAADRQARFAEMGQRAGGKGAARVGGAGGGMASGEILSKDDKSITLKLGESGTKIIFFSDTSEITKSVAGAAADLEVGKTVMVSGTANEDGSITAKTIQLRPATPQPQPAVKK